MRAHRTCTDCGADYFVESVRGFSPTPGRRTRCPECRGGRCARCGASTGHSEGGSERTYCDPCRAAWCAERSGRHDRVCLHCGQRYHNRRRRADEGVKFCSRACAFAAKAARAARRAVVDAVRVRREQARLCRICFGVFFDKATRAVLCSRECQQETMRREHHRRKRRIPPRYCRNCGADFTPKRGTGFLCSPRCAQSHARRNGASRDARRRGKVKRSARLRAQRTGRVFFNDVWRAANGLCWICGEACVRTRDPRDLRAGTIDHVVPLSRGGAHGPENVRLAHRICNSKKGDAVAVGA